MKGRQLITGLVMCAVGLGTGNPVLANGGDVIGGLIVGGLLGAAIANDQNHRRAPTHRYVAPKSGVSSAQREQNREVQTALNYFGYPVGTPDGSLGPKSRAAISQYQALLGFPATGQLAEMERQILVTGYNRAMIGGPQVQQIIASSPQGIRGVLLAQRDQTLGTATAGAAPAMMPGGSIGGLPPDVSSAVYEIARNANVDPMLLMQRAGFVTMTDLNNDGRTDYMLDTSVSGSGFWCNGPACTVEIFASTPQGYQRNDFQVAGATPAMFSCTHGACEVKPGGAPTTMAAQPAPVAPAPMMPTLPAPVTVAQPAAPAPMAVMPNFAAAMTPPKLTMASYCSAVGAKSGANGTPQTVAAMSDPAQALGEQFCAVSAAAKADGAALAAQIPGFTPAQITEQCKGFSAALKDQVAKIATTPRDDMVASIQGWLKTSGMPEAQLAATSKVCLGVGYETDDAEMALASALVLTGTGNMVYAEMIGHHLASGVGLEAHPALALDWYDVGLNALSVGQTPVFLPEQTDRAALIKKAALAINGRADALPMLPVPVVAETAPAPVAPSATVSTKSASIGGLAGFAGAAASLVSSGASMLPSKGTATAAP
ncbi:putative peptidoglycan binding protein [Rhodobacter viridis]|uniref:Putative peptidoglycan binding protein n=1 Tax=Rhodobacter viridis TaxID=1054202 RepID=A0A318U0A3_9RHOB|nr:peptidoglycan-binding domain-containing protein [Rhodobacter viridis]PYF09551.1 putative peptidoglycan binding protein [Rhodobacter viridis]